MFVVALQFYRGAFCSKQSECNQTTWQKAPAALPLDRACTYRLLVCSMQVLMLYIIPVRGCSAMLLIGYAHIEECYSIAKQGIDYKALQQLKRSE